MTRTDLRLAATLAILLPLHLAAAAPLRASEGADDLAARTFANGEQLMREGKAEQALKDFAQVAAAYPESPLADDALYRIGAHYFPATGIDGLGRSGRDAIQKAREAFQKIKESYPRSDRAPDALMRLGLIALDPDDPGRNSDEAYASFVGVVNIYPASAAVAGALFGAGYVDFQAGRYEKAISWFERAAEQHPADAAAETARYHMALALMRLGAWARACAEFQTLRDDWPKGAFASQALDRLSQIQKLRLPRRSEADPFFSHDPGFAPALPVDFGRGGVALAVDGASVVHLLDTRTGVVQRLGHDGRPVAAPASESAMPGASAIAVGASGETILSAGDRLRAGGDMVVPMRSRSGRIEPIEGISAAVRIGPREIAFLDGDASEILVHAGDPAQPRLLFADPQRRVRLAGLAAGAEGRLYTIDRRGRKILEIARDGSAREIPLDAAATAVLADPVGIAADDLGDLYILDRRSDALLVATTEGRTLQIIRSMAGDAAEFSEPGAVAVGPRGEIYVHDERRRTTIRFW